MHLSQDPTLSSVHANVPLTIFQTISAIFNILCMSRYCFKGPLFRHNYLPVILPPEFRRVVARILS
jgi:hypothetical protein